MEKRRALPVIVVLLYMASAARSDGGDVESACKRAADAKFCASLLQPYAAWDLSDGLRRGMAAVNATLQRVDELRELMVHEAVRQQSTTEELQTLSHCLSNVGNGEGALKVALERLNETKGAEREEVVKLIGSATTELTACADSLKKHTHDDVVRKALAFTEESLQACSLAQSFLP